MKRILPFVLLLFSLSQCRNPDVRKALVNFHVDTAKKLYALNDLEILNFIYGDCFPGRTLHNGKTARAEYLKNGIDGDSLFMKCESEILFHEGTDSLCYITVRGNMFDSLGHVMSKQYSMLLKYRKNYWKLASPPLCDTVIDPETFSGVEYYGPYVLLRFRRESIYSGGSISADDKYLCVYEGKLFPKGNYPSTDFNEKVTSICNYHPVHHQGMLKVNYNDSLKVMEYYFYGVENGLAKTEKNICYRDTTFNVERINNHNDPPDTLNYIPEEKMKEIFAAMKSRK